MVDKEVESLTEKVQELKLADDLFENYETVLGDLPLKESLTVKKLQLIDEYNNKREQLHDSLKEGFINVARANYATTSQFKYGRDYWDAKVKATKKLKVMGDNVKVVETENIRIADDDDDDDDDDHDDDDDDDDDEEQEEEQEEQKEEQEEQKEEGGTLRKRKKDVAKKKETKESSHKAKQKKKYNPINMFGVLVPYQLRAAQKEFDQSLSQIVQLTEIKVKLDSVDHELRRIYKKEQKQKKDTTLI